MPDLTHEDTGPVIRDAPAGKNLPTEEGVMENATAAWTIDLQCQVCGQQTRIILTHSPRSVRELAAWVDQQITKRGWKWEEERPLCPECTAKEKD